MYKLEWQLSLFLSLSFLYHIIYLYKLLLIVCNQIWLFVWLKMNYVIKYYIKIDKEF